MQGLSSNQTLMIECFPNFFSQVKRSQKRFQPLRSSARNDKRNWEDGKHMVSLIAVVVVVVAVVNVGFGILCVSLNKVPTSYLRICLPHCIEFQ